MVEIAPNYFAVVLEEPTKDIFYKEPSKLVLKDVEVNADSIYNNYIPRHYMVRQWDNKKE